MLCRNPYSARLRKELLKDSKNRKDEEQTKIQLEDKRPLIFKVADFLGWFIPYGYWDLKARPAKTSEDLEAAYKIVYKEYINRGFCVPNLSKLQYSFFCTLPDSRTFVLESGKKIVGTFSFFPDSPCGLPLDGGFGKEATALRKQGRKIAEAGLLALDLNVFSRNSLAFLNFKKLTAFSRLAKITFEYAQAMGITDVMVVVNPKHRHLWKYLKFAEIGEINNYAGAAGKAGVAFRLDMDRSSMLPHYFQSSDPQILVQSHVRWNKNRLVEFLVAKRSIWSQLSEEKKEVIRGYLSIDQHGTLSDYPAVYEKKSCGVNTTSSAESVNAERYSTNDKQTKAEGLASKLCSTLNNLKPASPPITSS